MSLLGISYFLDNLRNVRLSEYFWGLPEHGSHCEAFSVVMDELDPEVIAFVEAYIRAGFNASAAYRSIRRNVQDNTSWTEGSKYLRKPEVQKLLEEYSISASEALALLAVRARDDGDKSVQVRAIGLALKAHGLLLDKSEVKVDGQLSWREFVERETGE
jgi:hypothetical protein